MKRRQLLKLACFMPLFFPVSNTKAKAIGKIFTGKKEIAAALAQYRKFENCTFFYDGELNYCLDESSMKFCGVNLPKHKISLNNCTINGKLPS